MSKQNPIAANKRRSPKTVFLPPGFNPKFATFNEACAYARVCRYTGYQRVADGRWRSFKDGGRHMVEFASVRRRPRTATSREPHGSEEAGEAAHWSPPQTQA